MEYNIPTSQVKQKTMLCTSVVKYVAILGRRIRQACAAERLVFAFFIIN